MENRDKKKPEKRRCRVAIVSSGSVITVLIESCYLVLMNSPLAIRHQQLFISAKAARTKEALVFC